MPNRLTRISLFVALFFLLPAAAASANLTPTPPGHDWGNITRYNDTGKQEFVFSNDTADPINVDFAGGTLTGPDSDQFQINSQTCSGGLVLSPGEKCSVFVQVVAPTSLGQKDAQVSVVNTGGTATADVTANVISGELTPSSNPIQFSSQPYFYGQQYFDLQIWTNAYAVEIDSIAIVGPDAAQFSFSNTNCNNQTLFPFNSCGSGLLFSPSGPGTFSASVEIISDATNSPLLIPMEATALAGPAVEIAPNANDFGDVRLGESSDSADFTVSNTGDFPLEVQQTLVISGSPNEWQETNDSCSGSIVQPGEDCQLGLRFAPDYVGQHTASIYLITNTPTAVPQISLRGRGFAPASVQASIDGELRVGEEIHCHASDVSGELSYQWLRDGVEIPLSYGDRDAYQITEADFKHRLSCRVTASNPVDSVQVVVEGSELVQARDLSDLHNSLVSDEACRVLAGLPKQVGLGGQQIHLRRGQQIMPLQPLRIQARRAVRVRGSDFDRRGRSIQLPARTWSSSLGPDSLTLSSGGKSRTVSFVVADCQIAGQAWVNNRSAELEFSSHTGAGWWRTDLIRARILQPKTVRGTLAIEGFRRSQTFPFRGRSSNINGVQVIVRQRRILVRGLPGQTGVVGLSLSSKRLRLQRQPRLRFRAGIVGNGQQRTVIPFLRR